MAFERATAQGLEPVPAGLELRVMREGMQHISVFRCLVMKEGRKIPWWFKGITTEQIFKAGRP